MTVDMVNGTQATADVDVLPRIAVPDLTLTIAITGHRSIRPEAWASLSERIAAILTECRARLERECAASPLDRDRTKVTRFLSALAAGADQIGAEAALAAGWELDVILPYHEEAYVGALHEDLDPRLPARFAELRASASSVFALDDWTHAAGPLSEEARYWRDRRYWTLGQMLVRQADLLIAVWRGGPPAGLGGTANVVAEAHRVGLPIVWIDPDDGKVRVIPPAPATASDNVLAVLRHARGEEALDATLDATIGPLLAGSLISDPPQAAAGLTAFTGTALLVDPKRSRFRRLFGIGRGERVRRRSWAFPYQVFVWCMLFGCRHEGKPLRSWTGWRVELGGGGAIWHDPSRPQDAVLREPAIAADLVATARAHLYRSAYLSVFLLAALAVGFSLAGMILPRWKPVLVLCELGCLGLLYFTYLAARTFEWHTRWINSRHLTESLRGTRLTAWVGFAGRRPANADAPWTMWFANALAANASLGDRCITADEIASLATDIKAVVRDQESYNEKNALRLKRLHIRLEAVSAVLVLLAALIAFLYLIAYLAPTFGVAEPDHQLMIGFKNATTFAGGVLPALAAALAGIRYHGDFERFAERSHQTALQLRQIDTRLDRLHAGAQALSGTRSTGVPLYETLLDIALTTQTIFENDLQDWRFVYSARPTPGV